MDKPHKKLDLWNTAMELAVTIYQVTDSFPREERYSLTDQIRRAVSSVPSNVAEGAGRQTKRNSSTIFTWHKGAQRIRYSPRTCEEIGISCAG